MAREINLVPDIKNDMIKALKMRNLIFFLAIVVAISSVGITIITALIAGGQQLALDSKKNTIDNLSEKLNSYSDLKDFLTVRDQLGDIKQLTDNKKVLSRTFNILSALLPTGNDTIRISELNVNLAADSPAFDFEAQANAGQEPFIDYNVLDAFKKSMKYMRYDYGSYVDKDGNKIPAYCMVETSNDGSILNDGNRGIYAYWAIEGEGCDPNSISGQNQSETESGSDSSSASSNLSAAGYETEQYDGQNVVRIWRTPQFSEWYKTSNGLMDLSGQISGVSHFESSCTTYTGYDDPSFVPASDETVLAKIGNITWVSKNTSCLLVPEEEAGINIYDSSNGRDENNELVLRFSSTIDFAPEVFDFNNTHMLALAPSGRRNVTDSYVQIQAMFGERAADCAAGDATCAAAEAENNANNSNSNTNASGNSGSSDNTNQNERSQNG
ncbi:hypothetical protein IKE99_02100 [Candidatus Saccharibacteria bacterium]|nr:hypothetical protein [Candidatus Saccharibacteria bacterium]